MRDGAASTASNKIPYFLPQFCIIATNSRILRPTTHFQTDAGCTLCLAHRITTWRAAACCRDREAHEAARLCYIAHGK